MAYEHRTAPGDWRRRPRKAKAKTARVTFYVAPEDKAEILRRAAALNLSLTDYLTLKALGRAPREL